MGRLDKFASGKIGIRKVAENIFLQVFSPLHGANAELPGGHRDHDIRIIHGWKPPYQF